MRHALSDDVTLFDRRKGYGAHTMDRRRTYVDIMERVLGNEMLSRQPRQRSRFAKDISIAGASIGTAVSAVEVCVLDSIADKKR
jgi:hypothetical protein